MDRSLARIDVADLQRLAMLAAEAEAGLFERNPRGSGRYAGRRVDLLGRSLPAAHRTDPAHAIHDYLAAGRTTSARAMFGADLSGQLNRPDERIHHERRE